MHSLRQVMREVILAKKYRSSVHVLRSTALRASDAAALARLFRVRVGVVPNCRNTTETVDLLNLRNVVAIVTMSPSRSVYEFGFSIFVLE